MQQRGVEGATFADGFLRDLECGAFSDQGTTSSDWMASGFAILSPTYLQLASGFDGLRGVIHLQWPRCTARFDRILEIGELLLAPHDQQHEWRQFAFPASEETPYNSLPREAERRARCVLCAQQR